MAEASTKQARDPGAGARAGGSFAELMDRVVWDYSPRDAEPSPLVSTARYFDEFPWEGKDGVESEDEASGAPSST